MSTGKKHQRLLVAPEAEKGMDGTDSYQETPENMANTLVSDFYPPEGQENKSLLF